MVMIPICVPGGTSWARCKSLGRKLLKRRDSNTGKINRRSMFCQMEQ